MLILQLKFQKDFGTYTAQSYGECSNSNNKFDKTSSSMSLISRKLLTPDEVLKIENPYAIVMLAGKPPAITTIPDISKMYFNKLNGMGTREENLELRISRELKRKERPIQEIKIWDIWESTEDNVKINKIDFIKDKIQRNKEE